MNTNGPEDEALQGGYVDPLGRSLVTTGPEGLLQGLVLKGDLNSLTLQQKSILAAILANGDTAAAYDEAGVSRSTHNRWLRTNPVYAEAVAALGNGLLLEAQARLNSLYVPAAEALADALEAEKYIRVTCPCGCDHVFRVPIADLKLRVDVAKSVFQRSGDFGTSKVKVSGEVTHTTVTLSDRLTIEQLRRGMPVPQDVVASLRARGLLPTQPPIDAGTEGQYNPEVIEGEVLPR